MAGVLSKEIFRKAQRYSVSLYEKTLFRLADAGSTKPLFENFYYLENTDLYSEEFGLDTNDPFYRSSESNII